MSRWLFCPFLATGAQHGGVAVFGYTLYNTRFSAFQRLYFPIYLFKMALHIFHFPVFNYVEVNIWVTWLKVWGFGIAGG